MAASEAPQTLLAPQIHGPPTWTASAIEPANQKMVVMIKSATDASLWKRRS